MTKMPKITTSEARDMLINAGITPLARSESRSVVYVMVNNRVRRVVPSFLRSSASVIQVLGKAAHVYLAVPGNTISDLRWALILTAAVPTGELATVPDDFHKQHSLNDLLAWA